MSSDSVTVAVRVRPLLARDVAEGARECLRKVVGESQLVLGVDRAFTFDHVFEPDEPNGSVFESCAKELVEGTLEGFNCTIFAYGQTGKTTAPARAHVPRPHKPDSPGRQVVGRPTPWAALSSPLPKGHRRP